MCLCGVLILLEAAAIVGRQSHSSFDREFLHQVHRITCFGLLAMIRSEAMLLCAGVVMKRAYNRGCPVGEAGRAEMQVRNEMPC